MIKEFKMNSHSITELVFHLGRIASGEGLVEGLTAAQWSVLRYFAQANRFSRTPSAFAAFHGTTRGTASQTIKSLETQGYLTLWERKAIGFTQIRLGTNRVGPFGLLQPIADALKLLTKEIIIPTAASKGLFVLGLAEKHEPLGSS